MKTKIILIVSSLLIPLSTSAHSGGTDKNGCHHDRKNGGYHCHKSHSEDDTLASKKSIKKVRKPANAK